MPEIHSVSSNTTANTSSNTRKANSTDSSSSEADRDKSTSADVDTQASSVSLSTRAQKIQKLNEEFFSGGPRSVKITPEFIERLYEYGFINAEQAEKLGAKSLASGPTGTLGELSSFIDEFTSQLIKEDPENSFIEVLNEAKSIIANFDRVQSSENAANITTVSAQISQFLSSQQAESLSAQHKRAIEQLDMALTIADRLSPSQLSSEKINNYLSIVNRSK